MRSLAVMASPSPTVFGFEGFDWFDLFLPMEEAVSDVSADSSNAGPNQSHAKLAGGHLDLPSDVVGVKLGGSLAGNESSEASSTCA